MISDPEVKRAIQKARERGILQKERERRLIDCPTLFVRVKDERVGSPRYAILSAYSVNYSLTLVLEDGEGYRCGDLL